METLIRATDVTRDFGRHRALSSINLTLERGDVLGLLGPNGAGKTTCLRVLAGLLAPSHGTVEILGVDLFRHPRAAKVQLGYLSDQPPLYPELRVDEYLSFCARLRRIPPARLAGALDRAKHRCGLDSVGKHLIAALSKGFRQRLGIAQAILHQPQVLILDEPTDGLDPYQMREMRALIRDLAHDCGVIFSSHRLPEVQMICDRVAIIHQGRIHYGDYLAADHAPHLWRIRVDVEPPRLESIQCLDAFTPLGENRYRVVLKNQADSADLARELVDAGIALYELQAERSDLERIFFNLTGAEDET